MIFTALYNKIVKSPYFKDIKANMSPGYAEPLLSPTRYQPRGALGSIPQATTQDLGSVYQRFQASNPMPARPTTASSMPIGETGMTNYMADIKSPGYLLDKVAPKYSDKISRFMLGVTPDTTQGELDRIEANRKEVQARTLAGLPETTAEQDAIMANQRQRELFGGTPGIPKAFDSNVGRNPFTPFEY